MDNNKVSPITLQSNDVAILGSQGNSIITHNNGLISFRAAGANDLSAVDPFNDDCSGIYASPGGISLNTKSTQTNYQTIGSTQTQQNDPKNIVQANIPVPLVSVALPVQAPIPSISPTPSPTPTPPPDDEEKFVDLILLPFREDSPKKELIYSEEVLHIDAESIEFNKVMNENEIPPLSESKNVTLRDNSINTNQTTYNTQINKNSITPYLVTYLLHQQGPGGAPALLYYSFIKPIPFVSRDQAREDGFGRKGISVSTNQYGYYLSDKSKSANIGKDFFILFPAAQSKKQTPQHTRYVFQRRRWYDTSYFTPLNFLVYYTYKWEIIYKTGNKKGKCPQNIEIILKKYAIKHNVPLDLFKGMCYIESAFNPKSGATGPYKGLFQLGKPVWDEYYKFKIDWSKNALDPDLNADCGGELTSDNMITASKLIQKYVK